MPREHARVKLSIWDDDDFRALSAAAQHLYFVLLTSPELSYAGVTDWRPNRISRRAGAWTTHDVEIAAKELCDGLFLVIDADTEEVLLRSFVRNDGLMDQPNLAVAMKKAHAALASGALRAVVVHELRRLHKDKPELKGWAKASELLDRPSLDPSECPSFHPSENPSDRPSSQPLDDPSPKGSAKPSSQVSPTTAPSPTPRSPLHTTEDQQLEEDRYETSAAAPATTPPTCSRHPNGNPTDESCAGCRRVREHGDRLEAQHRKDEADRIRNCPDCGGSGWLEDPDTREPAGRCSHPKARRTA